MHDRRSFRQPPSRREMLLRCANGFGAVALTALLTERAYGSVLQPLAERPGHHRARASSVIFLYMDGGPSQVDTFDPKPRLDREDGQPIKMKVPPTQFIPHDRAPIVMRSPWKFRQHGRSGLPVSDLFPHVAGRVDDLCVIRSTVAGFSARATANLSRRSGVSRQGRPSVGAWVASGVGSECQDLPGFIVLKGGQIPAGGPDNFHSGFLPAVYQGSIFRDAEAPVANLQRT